MSGTPRNSPATVHAALNTFLAQTLTAEETAESQHVVFISVLLFYSGHKRTGLVVHPNNTDVSSWFTFNHLIK